MNEVSKISYAPNVEKGLEAILWLVNHVPEIDIYRVCKCLYFADIKHLSRYGRSIFGERYEADMYGPRGEVAYGVIRNRMGEVIALGGQSVPVRALPDMPYTVIADRGPNLDKLSDSDVEALEEAVAENAHKDFDTLYKETHDHTAYIEANGGVMDYRLMVQQIVSDIDRDRLNDIAVNARTAVF